jgi:multidrug efflux pump subunit AcrA (membrane-fusion protein)
MKIKKSIFIYVLIALIIVIAIFGFLLFKNGEYSTYEVQRKDFVQVTEVSGKVIPAEEIDLSFEVSGKISTFNVKVGDEVKAGDLLVKLDMSEVQGEIDEASASLKSEKIKLSDISENNVTSQSRLDSVKNTLINTLNSYISGISTSRTSISSIIVDISSKTENVRDVEADIPLTEAAIDNVNATLDKLLAKRDKYLITAPFDGIVTVSDLEVGQVVTSGEVVISMISSNGLEVEAFIPEVNIAGVNIGDTATLTFDAFGEDEEFYGTISHIDPRETIKDGVTTYKIIVEFDSYYEQIFSGMTNEIVIEKTRQDNQVVIPSRLITSIGGQKYVSVLDGTNVVDVEIKTGSLDGRGNILVTSGLKVGDLIIEQ